MSGAAIRRFHTALFIGAGLLILATALADLRAPIVANPIARELDLEREGNFAVWYSSTVLLMAAVGALAVGQRTRSDCQ